MRRRVVNDEWENEEEVEERRMQIEEGQQLEGKWNWNMTTWIRDLWTHVRGGQPTKEELVVG